MFSCRTPFTPPTTEEDELSILRLVRSRRVGAFRLVQWAIAMTIGCALMFKYALGLPIPLAPWLLGL